MYQTLPRTLGYDRELSDIGNNQPIPNNKKHDKTKSRSVSTRKTKRLNEILFDIILNNFGLFTKNIKLVSVLRLAFSKIICYNTPNKNGRHTK